MPKTRLRRATDTVPELKSAPDSPEAAACIRRADEATSRGGAAYERLLRLAESSQAGQAGIVAEFIASTVGYVRFDLYDLRALDVELSDDVLSCLDAIRWGRVHLCDLVRDGTVRANTVSHEWGYNSQS